MVRGYRVNHDTRGLLRYLARAAMHLKKLLKQKDSNKTRIASMISSFEFACNISKLHNLQALKMNKMIQWDNIDVLEAQVWRNLLYFHRLRMAQLRRKEEGMKRWEITFPAKETYDIMRLSFRGYFVYT